MPLADACICLPWVFGYGLGDPALVIEEASADGAIRSRLAGVDRLHYAAVRLRAHVIEMRHHLQAGILKRQMAIGIKKIGLILVNQVRHAVEVMPFPRLGNIVVVPIELLHQTSAIGIVI